MSKEKYFGIKFEGKMGGEEISLENITPEILEELTSLLKSLKIKDSIKINNGSLIALLPVYMFKKDELYKHLGGVQKYVSKNDIVVEMGSCYYEEKILKYEDSIRVTKDTKYGLDEENGLFLKTMRFERGKVLSLVGTGKTTLSVRLSNNEKIVIEDKRNILINFKENLLHRTVELSCIAWQNIENASFNGEYELVSLNFIREVSELTEDEIKELESIGDEIFSDFDSLDDFKKKTRGAD